MKKAEVLELITKLPDDEEVDVEQLIYTLGLMRSVERGLAEAETGVEISLDEIQAMIDEWPE